MAANKSVQPSLGQMGIVFFVDQIKESLPCQRFSGLERLQDRPYDRSFRFVVDERMTAERSKVFRTAQQRSPDCRSVGLEDPGELTHIRLVAECFSDVTSEKTDLMRSALNSSKFSVVD
jgi:hypothetical protein